MWDMRIVLIVALLSACGDNLREGGPNVHPEVLIDGDVSRPDGDGVFGTCPDAVVDASVPGSDDGTKAACCHALLKGMPPSHECGYPPGLCKNGRRTMFCKTAGGDDAQFELCNP
jgi:hypothetical protein